MEIKNSIIKKLSVCFVTLFIISLNLSAQLDTIHYVPATYTNATSDDGGNYYLVMSTNETTSFTVTIRNGDNSYINTVSLSASSPQTIFLGKPQVADKMDMQTISGTNISGGALGVVGKNELLTKQSDEGLIVSGSKPFFVNIRYKSSAQGAIYTSKGSVGLGTEFYSGHMYSVSSNYNVHNSHFISVMATENNTYVIFNNDNIMWNGSSHQFTSVKLDAGDTYTLGLTNAELNVQLGRSSGDKSGASLNEANGTHIRATKPIAVNTGSWSASGISGNSRDMGFDQLVPVAVIGTDYIVTKGRGVRTNSTGNNERIIIVATQDNTRLTIYDDGNSNPSTVIIPTTGAYHITNVNDYYEGTNNKFNVYFKADKPVYTFQTMVGHNAKSQTAGFCFIPPLKCTSDPEVTIPFADNLSELSVDPALNVVTQAASIIVNGVTYSSPNQVRGKSSWNSFSITGLADGNKNTDDHWHVKSSGGEAINASISVYSDNVGAASFFSGFGTVPEISFSPILEQNGLCAGNAVLNASGFTNYNWYKNGGIISGEEDSIYVPTGPGRYKVIGVTTCDGQPGYTYPSGEVLLLPCLSIQPDSLSITEGDIANPNANFTIELSHPWNEDKVTFDYSTQTITASQGADYTSVSGSGSIATGNTSFAVSIPISNDLLAEDTESFNLKLSNVAHARIEVDSGTAYIFDDGDPMPIVNLESSKSVNENTGAVTFNITLDRPSGQLITVDYSITDISTLQTTDYTSAAYSGTISFLPGEITKVITINVTDDNIYEPGGSEQLRIELSATVNVVDGNLTSTLTLNDNESIPVFTVAVVNAPEGNDIVFNGTLNHSCSEDILFQYTTQDITASSADYSQIPLTFDTIKPGNTNFSLTVTTSDDVITEGSEQFNLRIDNLQNAEFTGGLSGWSILSTIFDNEGLPQITLQDALVVEGNAVKIPVTISHPSSTPISFEYFTLAQSATEGTDYSGINPAQTITIAANTLNDTITVNTIEDTEEEGNESFEAHLANSSSNAQFSDSVATITIVDNDETPVANTDAFVTNEDTPVSDNVKNNDAGLGDTPITILLTTAATKGTVSLDAATGDFTYTPDANFNGTDSIQYTIRDADSDESSAWCVFTVVSINDLPNAVNDVFTIAENATLDTTVLHNDTGLGDGYTLSIQSTSLSGSLSFNPDGSFTYTPLNQFYGTESFTYEIEDGNGDKTTATVQIAVNFSNDYDPVAVNDTIATPEDTPVDITVLSNDFDTDNNTTIDIASVNIITTVSDGSTSIDYATGTVTYTPDLNFQGSDFFEYQISDDDGRTSNTARVIITVTQSNDVPVAVCNDTVETYLDASGGYTLAKTTIDNGSYDNDSDPMTFLLSKTAFTCADVGYNAITMTVRDPLLAQSTCTSIVNVKDTIAPVAHKTVNDTTIYSDGSSCGQLVSYSIPQFIDNCSGIQNGSLVAGYSSGSVFPIGATQIRYGYTDASGNTSQPIVFIVELMDTVSPLLSCTDDTVVVNNGSNFIFSGSAHDASVTEKCSFSITQDYNGSTTLNGIVLPIGSHVISWSATDVNGNSSGCAQTISVYDSLKVTLTSNTTNDTACIGSTVLFTANVTGGYGTANYKFYIDNTLITAGVSGNTLTTDTLTDMQEVKVLVEDAIGNSVQSNSIKIKLFRRVNSGPVHHVPVNWGD